MCQKVEMEESQIKNTVWRVSEGQLTIVIPSMMDQTVGQKQSKNSLNNFEFNLQFYQFLIWKFRHHWCDEKITKKVSQITNEKTNKRTTWHKEMPFKWFSWVSLTWTQTSPYFRCHVQMPSCVTNRFDYNNC